MPVPRVQPPTTSSCSGRILTFCQAIERLPGWYGRAAVLGHDPFEAALLRRLEERDPVPRDVLAQSDAGIGAEDLPEQAPTFLERLVEQRPAVEEQQVEDLVHERVAAPPRPCPLILAWRSAKSGSPRVVERDDLAIDDRLARRDPRRRSRNGPKYLAASCWPRVHRRTSSPSTTASTRKPSHLTSNDQSGSSNGAATSVASIGGMKAGIASDGVFAARRLGTRFSQGQRRDRRDAGGCRGTPSMPDVGFGDPASPANTWLT